MNAVWHGRRGTVALGPTQHRVARYLHAQTRHGRVRIRSTELAEILGLERSETYRITARLRMLGLFGVANDPGGARGGRWYWRTAIAHDGPGLDADRHRTAWSRLVAWSKARRARVVASIEARRVKVTGPLGPTGPVTHPSAGVRGCTVDAGEGSFAERMRRHGLGGLLDAWGVAS